MEPREIQRKLASNIVDRIKKYKIAYVAAQERVGKTLATLLANEELEVSSALVITKKKALPDWKQTIIDFKGHVKYELINYESVHKIFMPRDLVILDEAHSFISKYPKPSRTWEKIQILTQGKKIIYLSATPYAQGISLLYHQLALSWYSPWKSHKSFYSWYKTYAKMASNGEYKTIRISSTATKIDYSAVQTEKAYNSVKHLFMSATRKEAGFLQEPQDKVYFIQLSEKTKKVYNKLQKTKVLKFTHKGREYTLICDSIIKLRWALHMLEGGTLKVENEYLNLGSTEKIDFILSRWGDTKSMVIMYHYKADKIKLEASFNNATLLQATTYAEGISLHKYKILIIYSMDFSTAKYSQRRARQANFERTEPIIVHFLLVKNAISHQVYKTVALNKQNFIDSIYQRINL